MRYMNPKSKIRDIQDGIELHMFKYVEYDKDLMYVNVEGTGTIDPKVPVVNAGYSFNLANNTNAEVLLLANGSNVNDKIAIMLIPRDKQKQWKKRTGGIQNPENPEQVVEFNPKRTQIRGNKIALGNKGQIEIDGDNVIIRGHLFVEGDLSVKGSIEATGNIGCDKRGYFKEQVNTILAQVGGYTFTPVVPDIELPEKPFEDYTEIKNEQ